MSQLSSQQEAPHEATAHTVALIGHKGRMGAMLLAHWQAAGYEVRGADITPAESTEGAPPPHNTSGACLAHAQGASENRISFHDLQQAATGADVVVLCVPARTLPAVLETLVPILRTGQILIDITSVKMIPMQQMEAAFPGPVVGTHPLFGPVALPEDLTVAITPGQRAQEQHIALVEELFTCFGCKTFRTTPQEHDRGVAFVQGLNFVSSAAYFASLAHREDVLPFLTPSFRRRLEGARKLLTEDANMFQGFTAANPMTADAIHTFRLFLDLVEGGGLPDVVQRAHWWYESEK